MSISNLIEAAEKSKQEKKAKAITEAKARISDEFSLAENQLKKNFPSLFEERYPIKRWVIIEPSSPDGRISGTPEGCIAGVLENNLVLCIYRNSACWCFEVFPYATGSDDCWVKRTKCQSQDLLDVVSNQENLANLITLATKD